MAHLALEWAEPTVKVISRLKPYRPDRGPEQRGFTIKPQQPKDAQRAQQMQLQQLQREEPSNPRKRPRTEEERGIQAEIIAQGARDWFYASQENAYKQARGITPEDAWKIAKEAAKEQTSSIADCRTQEAVQVTRAELLNLIVNSFSALSQQGREARSIIF